MGYEGRRIFQPVSIFYIILLAMTLVIVVAFVFIAVGDLLVQVLGLPPEALGAFFFVSLVGSFVNIPVGTLESRVPMVSVSEVNAFGVRWRVPSMRLGVQRTHILINLGGAIVPIVVSGYLLGLPLIQGGKGLAGDYLGIMAVLLIVTVLVNRTAKVIEGFGIATPALAPPLATLIATLLVNIILPLANPVQAAYIGGTLGTLIGADLLNLENVRDVGAPAVSIGGAGTFDGVYLTGIVSVLLVFLALG